MDVTADEFTNRRKKSSRPNKSINDDGFSRVLKDGLKDDTSVFKSIQSNLNPPPPLPGVFVFDPPNHQAKVDSNFNHSSKQLFPTYNISQSVSNYSAPTHSAPYGKMLYSEPNMHEIHADQINFQTPVMYDYPLNPEQRGFKSLQPTVSDNIDSMIPSDTNVYQSLQPVPHNAFDMSSHSEPKVYQQLQTMSQIDLHMDSVKGTDSKSYHQLSPVYQPLNPVRPSDKMFRESKVFQQPRPVVPSYDSPQFVNSKLYQQLCQPSNTEVRKTYRPEVKTYQQLQPVTVSDFEHVRHPNTFSQCKSTNQASLSKSMQDYKNICVNNPPRSCVPNPTSYDINNVKSSNNFNETQQRSFQTSKPKIYLELRNPDVRHPSEAKSELHQRLSQCHAEGQNTSLPFTDCRSHSKSINKKNDEFKLPSPYKFNLPHGNASNKYMSEVGPNEFSSRGVRTPEKGQPSIVNKTFGSPNESRLASIPAKHFSGVSHMEPACSPTKPNKISLSLPKSPVCYGDLGAKSNPAVKYYPETSSVFSNEIGRSDHSFTDGVMPAGVTTFDSQLGVGTNSNSHSSNTILPVADSKPKESGSREITKTVSVSVKEKSLSSEPSEKVNFTNQNSGTLNQSKSEKLSPKTYLQITENLTYSCNTSNTSGKQTLLKNNQNSPSILLNSIQHKSNVEDLTKKMFFSEGVKIDTPNSQFVKSLGLPVSENAVGNKQLISGAPTVIEIPSEDAKKNKEVFSTSTNIDHSLNKPVSVDVQSHEKNEPSEVIGTTEDQAQSKNDSSSTINNIINTKTLSNSLTQKMTLSKYDSDVIPGCVIKKYRKRKYHGLPIEKISQELIAETTRDCDIKNILESATQDVAAVAAKDYNKEIKQELQLSSLDVSSETAIDFNAETKLESQPLPQDIAAEPAKDCNTESKLESEPLSPNMAAKTSKGLEAESNLEPEALSLDTAAETAKDCNTESKLESEPLSPNMAAKTSKDLKAESNLEPEALSLDMPAETAKDCNTESKLESEPLSPNMAAKTSKDLKAESNLEPEALSLDIPAETAKDCNTESKLELEPLSPNVAAKTSKDLKAEPNLEPEPLPLDMAAETAKDLKRVMQLKLHPLPQDVAAVNAEIFNPESKLESKILLQDIAAETASDSKTKTKLESQPLSQDMDAEKARDCNIETEIESPLTKTLNSLKEDTNSPSSNINKKSKHWKTKFSETLDSPPVKKTKKGNKEKCEIIKVSKPRKPYTRKKTLTPVLVKNSPIVEENMKNSSSNEECSSSKSQNFNEVDGRLVARVDTHSEGLSPPVDLKTILPKKRKYTKRSNTKEQLPENKRAPSTRKSLPGKYARYLEEEENYDRKSGKKQIKLEYIDPLEEGLISDDGDEVLFLGFDVPDEDDDTILGFDFGTDKDDQDPFSNFFSKLEADCVTVECDPRSLLQATANTTTCSQCDKACVSHMELVEHMQLHAAGQSRHTNSYVCVVCFRGFHTQQQLDRHFKWTHEGGKRFGCPLCSKRFTTSNYVKRHVESVHGEVDAVITFSCGECTLNFPTEKGLNLHDKKVHSSNRKKLIKTVQKKVEEAILFFCDECTISFPTKQALKYHEDNVHSYNIKKVMEKVQIKVEEATVFSCSECTLNFSTEQALKSHADKVHSSNTKKLLGKVQIKVEEATVFSCGECTLNLPTEQALKSHEDKVHSSNTKKFLGKVQIKVEEATVFFCGECTLNFPTEKALKTHENKVHNKPLHQCDECLKYFVKFSNLKRHKLIHTRISQTFPCAYCNQTFNTKGLLHAHWPVHTDKKMFQCDVCGSEFTAPNSLKRHKVLHAGEKLFRCEICQRSFSLLSTLKTHLLIHTGARRFPCKLCHKTFNRRDVLNAHQWIHTGEKRFQCDVCLQKFRWRHAVKSHKLIYHSTEKPFACETCGKRFSHPDSFKKHAEVHADKIYYCQICLKAFSRPSTLKAHILIHTDLKPFFCDTCHRGFRSKSHLRNHFLVHTKEKPWLCKFCNKTYKDRNQLRRHKRLVHCTAFYKKMLSGIPEESKTVDNFDIISAAEDVLRENQGLSEESNIPFSENGTFEHFISLPLQNDHIKTEERVVDY